MSARTRRSQRLIDAGGFASVIRTAGLLIGVVLTLLAAQTVTAADALAHDELLSAAPADGAQMTTSPAELTLTFSGPVSAEFSQVAVTGPDGAPWQAGPPTVAGNTLTQPLTEQGPAGTYQVAWRVVSSDGHPISGAYSYVVTAGPSTTAATTSAAPSTAATPTASESAAPDASASPSAQAGATETVTASSIEEDGATNWLPVALILLVVTAGLAAAAVLVSRRRRGVPGG